MSKELIERLRIFGSEPDTGNTYHEAADVIEQLQREVAKYQEQLPRVWAEINRGQAENDAQREQLAAAQAREAKLREALEEAVAGMGGSYAIWSVKAKEALAQTEVK